MRWNLRKSMRMPQKYLKKHWDWAEVKAKLLWIREKFMIAEIMREKILLKFDKEIPHGIAIVINTFQLNENGVYEVNLDIVCERANHKAILIGKQGKAIKEVSSFARQDMEKFLGGKVFLTTYVKVKEDWRDRPGLIREYGYEDVKQD